MKVLKELLRKTVSVFVVTFLFLQFFTVSPLISEGNENTGSDNTQTTENNTNNTSDTDPSDGDFNDGNENENNDDVDPNDNNNPSDTGDNNDDVDPNEGNDQGNNNDPADNNQNDDTNQNQGNNDYPAFYESQIIDDEVKITVVGEENIFPAGAVLYVERIENIQELDEALDEVRSEYTKVAVSYTYDIKVLDKDDNELQPLDGNKVRISFVAVHVANDNLMTNVYHINETNPEDITADNVEILDVATNGEEAIVETESFSLYTVEFTYNNFQYVLDGNTSVLLSVILNDLGLLGNVENVEVSDSELFDVTKNDDDEYVLTAKKAFSSEEWMKITIDGIVYEIVVTDTAKSLANFAADSMLTEYHIDKTKLTYSNATVTVDTGSTLEYNSTAHRVQTTTQTSGYEQRIPKEVGNVKVTYTEAAADSEGNRHDLELYFKDVTIYVCNNRNSNKIFYILDLASLPVVSFGQPASSTSGLTPVNAGMTFDLDITIKDAASDATYFVSYNDFDSNRSTGWASAETYYPGHNSFNESIKVNTSLDVYYADGRALEQAYMRDGWYVPGYGAASDMASRKGAGSEVVFRNNKPTASASFRTNIMSGESGGATRVINVLTFNDSHIVSASSGPFGKYEIWNDGQIDGDTKLYEGRDQRTYDVPNRREVTIKFTPEDGYKIKSLQMNGGQVSAVARDEQGRVVPAKDAVYYTYTMPASHTTDAVFYVEWTKPNIDCIDCKNFEACENCYLALASSDLIGYTNRLEKYHTPETQQSALGVYRGTSNGQNAVSGASGDTGPTLDSEQDPQDNTFAKPLPYGTIYIDPTRLVWDNDHLPNIDFQDSRFKLVGTGKTASGPTAYPDAVPGDDVDKNLYSNIVYDLDVVRLSDADNHFSYMTPTIAYYGPIHSYLRYGSETDNNLGYYPRDNTAAIDANVANGVYKAKDKDNVDREIKVVNGTNIIEAPAGSYLYKVTYKDAAILQDGSRGNLEVIVTKVEIESSVSSGYGATIDTRAADCAVVGVQKANQMQVNGGFAHVGVASTTAINTQNARNAIKNFIGRDRADGSTEIRNGIGARTDVSFQVVRSDGTPVEGIISYAANDLDINSWQSIWGRKPDDTYTTDHKGTISATDPDFQAKDAWTSTYQFNRFAEGFTINSGALSYALLPYYNHHRADPDVWDASDRGNLPVNNLLKDLRNSATGLEGYESLESPLKVIASGTTDGLTANGYTFIASSTYKARNTLGKFSGPFIDGSTHDYTRNDTHNTYRATRNDRRSYDTGFAVLLNAVGTSLTWSGSNHTNDGINTTLFDTKFVQYLRISHGTGGGIYVEDYHVTNDCEPEYRENMLTIPYGSSVKSTIVPEDGYRVNKITVDDIKITITYNDDDSPKSAIFEYGDPTLPPQEVDFVNGTANPNRLISAQYDEAGDPLTTYRLIITANDDGIFDVEMYDRNYVDIDGDGVYDSARHNIHADFDTFYYFTKVWADAGSHPEDLPTTLTFTASPYVLEHDKVVLNGVEYDITETREMHMDVIDDEGNKWKVGSKYLQYPLHTSLDEGALLLNIGGHRQVYPTFYVSIDEFSDIKYVVIGDECYPVTIEGGQEVPDWTNPIHIIRSEDGYEIIIPTTVKDGPTSAKHPGKTALILHHVKRITFSGTDGSIYTTTDNPDYKSDGTYSDIVYVEIGTRIQKPYSLIKIANNHYVITGNKLHKVIRNANGEWVEDTTFMPIDISSEFERYNDGTYISKKDFIIDITDPEHSKYVSQSYINDGQDLVWKVKYPAKGLDFNDDKDYDDEKDWPALAIETEHIYDDMHEINADHVNRLYWFVNERLGTLTGKWALDGYTNDNTAVEDIYRSNSEAPGLMSYRDYLGNVKYNTTYFYLLAIEDHEEVLKELGDMAELRMAFMSPISSETIRRDSYSGQSYSIKKYTEWGGMVVNSIHQTKLQVKKNWIGGDGEVDPATGEVIDRIPFKMTIHRDYNYKQISHIEVATPAEEVESDKDWKKVVTLPNGADFREILYRLADQDASKVKRFRNGTEPLTSNKNAAIVLQDDGTGRVANLSDIKHTKLVKIPYNTFSYFDGTKQPEYKEASVYLWFDDKDDGTIYMWTDADHVFMAEDASGMFKDFDYLEQISGVHILNTSQTKKMTSMFEATTSGKITNLYNVREWDTSKVENFDNFLNNQNNLNHIHGLIDWNLSSADSFTNFIGTAPSTADWSRYDGSEASKMHLFIWYPNVYIDSNGNVVTPDGQPLTKAHSQTSDGTARDLRWDSNDLSNMGTWWNNGINTPTNYTDSAPYTTWEWDIQEDNMAYSDATKWSYRLYENDYGIDYVNSDFALDLLNSKEFVYNELTGKWEATLTNVKTTSINIQKKTVNNENGEFKFRVKFESVYEPEDIVDKPTENTIVVAKRFVGTEEENRVYKDLSDDPNDYAYIGEEYKLTLHSNGSGSDPSAYDVHIDSKVFPDGWTKNSNGTWSYVFEGIDDDTVSGYLVTEPSNVKFRYQGSTEESTFTSIISSEKIISQQKDKLDYHSARFENESSVGRKSDIQRSQTDELKENIEVEYQKGDGLKKIRYEVWDGQQYDNYDVIIGVDSEGNIRYREDGGFQHFEVYYGGVETGTPAIYDIPDPDNPGKRLVYPQGVYPYYIYTDDPDGSVEYESVVTRPTYDKDTKTTVFVGTRGLHTLSYKDNEHFHLLEVVENIGSREMTYGEAKAYPKLPTTAYIFKDPVDSKITYQFNGTVWKKYDDGVEDPSWTSVVPPDETKAIINQNKMTEIWGTKYPNDRRIRKVDEYPNYQTSGSYKVTNPATGIAEEYYIIEQLGSVVSATHKKTDDSGTTETTIENIISSIGFNADTGEAKFETSDGREYHFSNSKIVVVPNIWEFTLRNEEDFTLHKIPLGTTYEVWEYDLSGEWTLIDRDEKRVTLNTDGTVDPDSETDVRPSTTDQYEGGDNLETIKKYSYMFKEDPTVSDPDTYYQYKTGKIVSESEYVANRYYEYETYSNDVSILKIYKKVGEVYVEDNNASPKYYKQIYTKTRPTESTADLYVGYDGSDPSSCTKYKLDYYEAANGTFYKKKSGSYTNDMPIDQSHNTSTGNGGIKRFIGNTDVVRHIFTNEKDTFSLTIDKTVKGNQGSKDQYFKFIVEIDNLNEDNSILTINDAETLITTSFFIPDQENGTYYRYKDGRYTEDAPTSETLNIYVGCTVSDTDPSCAQKYKANKPNVATEFFKWIMSNANNRDDSIAQRIEPVSGEDYLTFEEAKKYVAAEGGNPSVNYTDYEFEVPNTKYPDYPTKYDYIIIDDTTDPKTWGWVEFTWYYDQDDAGSSYKKVNADEYIDNKPVKSDVPKYVGYNESSVQSQLDKYDALGQPWESGTVYYKYVNGGIISYEVYNTEHRMDYENAYELALDTLTTYKPSYHPKDVTEDEIPLDAITLGMAGRQIIANNGKVSFVVYLKHGESIKIDGFNKGATYTITEEIEGLKDYKTTITDASGKQEILSKTVKGEFGKDVVDGLHVEEDENGAFYKILDGSGYERLDKYYADYKIGEDINNLPKYKIEYSDRPSGTYYIRDYDYVEVAPEEDIVDWHYDEFNYDAATAGIKCYKEASDGDYYRTDNTYTETKPDGETFSTYIYTKFKVEGGLYVKDPNGNYYYLPSSGTYTLDDPRSEDYEDYLINKYRGYSIDECDTGCYFPLKNGSETELPPTETNAYEYVGYSIKMIRKYRQDFVEDPNGTYYRTVNADPEGRIVYTEVSPAERYDLSKTYTCNVTAKYTNTKDGIIPTKAFAGYFMPLIIMNSIALCWVLYERKRKADGELDE